MKLHHKLNALAVTGTALLTACLACLVQGSAQAQTNTLTNGLVAYWPMDVVTNGTTPDVSHGYDMILSANMNATNFVTSTLNGGVIGTLSTNSAGNAVYFNASQDAFLYYLASPGQFLPINLQSNYTINLWIKIVGSNQSDVRIFAEDDLNGNSNPLWVVGTGGGGGSSEDENLHWLKRQQSITINGLAQGPDVDETQNQAYTSLNPCDGNWHMVTITKQFTNNLAGSNVENFEVYVDTVIDPGNTGSALYSTELDAFGNQAVMVPEPVTNQDHPPTPWTWLINATSFGGLSRTLSGGNFITGYLDEPAMWNRPLTTNEITNLFQYGITNVQSTVAASISSFSFDASEVLYGDTVTLRWNTSHATSLVISPTIGNVTAISVNGIGSTNLTITSGGTYTLVASRPGSSVTNTASVVVDTKPVASNWHLIERFDSSAPSAPGIGGIPTANWDNVLGDFTGPLDYFFVSTQTNTNAAVIISNNVAGTAQGTTTGGEAKGALSAYLMNGRAVQPGASNTLFFRAYIASSNVDENDFSFFIGLSDTNVSPLAVSVFDGGDIGPRINITRTLTGTGDVVDVQATNGVAGYDVVYDGTTNTGTTMAYSSTNPNGLTTGVVYDFWIDVADLPYGSATNNGVTNTSGPLFSVYFKQLGAPTRTLLFTNLLSNRSPFQSAPGQLGVLFLMLDSEAQNGNIVAVGTNTIVIDDLYLSKSNLNATIPTAPGVFPDLIVPTSIALGDPVYSASGVTLSWSSIPGATYTVYKTSNLTSSAPWQLVTTELPAGGGSVTTYTDTSLTGQAYYQVTSP